MRRFLVLKCNISGEVLHYRSYPPGDFSYMYKYPRTDAFSDLYRIRERKFGGGNHLVIEDLDAEEFVKVNAYTKITANLEDSHA